MPIRSDPTVMDPPRRRLPHPAVIAIPAFVLTMVLGLGFIALRSRTPRQQQPIVLPPPPTAENVPARPFRQWRGLLPRPNYPGELPRRGENRPPSGIPPLVVQVLPKMVRYREQRHTSPSGYGSLEERVIELEVDSTPPKEAVRVPDDTLLHNWRSPLAPFDEQGRPIPPRFFEGDTLPPGVVPPAGYQLPRRPR